jgi:hypothetical protein
MFVINTRSTKLSMWRRLVDVTPAIVSQIGAVRKHRNPNNEVLLGLVILRVVSSFFHHLGPYKSAGGAFEYRRQLNKDINYILLMLDRNCAKVFTDQQPRIVTSRIAFYGVGNWTYSRERRGLCLPSIDTASSPVVFKMKIVGYWADRHGHGYLRTEDEKGAFGWKDHLLRQQDSFSSQTSLVATERNPYISSTYLQFRYRYKGLQDEAEGRSSKICGGQFFYKWKVLKGRSKSTSGGGRNSNSSSLTDGSSECRSIEEEHNKTVEETHSSSNAAVQNHHVETKCHPCDDAMNEKLNNRNRSTYIDLLPYDIKDDVSCTFESVLDNTLEGDSLNYSLSDIAMSNSFSGHEWFVKGSKSDKDGLAKHWIRYAQDEMTTVIIAQLLEDCEYYQTETVALREEIEFMKAELGCLRQQIPGLKTWKMLV